MNDSVTPPIIPEAVVTGPEVMTFLLGQMDAWWDTLSPAQKMGLWVTYGREPS